MYLNMWNVTAKLCTDVSDCELNSTGPACIDRFCQPEFCNATAQCAGEHVCSQDAVRRCAGKNFSYLVVSVRLSVCVTVLLCVCSGYKF